MWVSLFGENGNCIAKPKFNSFPGLFLKNGTRLESDTLGLRAFSFPNPAASFGHVVFEAKQIKPSGC